MSDNDVRVFHRRLAETMTAEVQSWEGSGTLMGSNGWHQQPRSR